MSSISDGSALAVVAGASCEIRTVRYQTTLLVERAGTLLAPALIGEIKSTVQR